MAGLNPEHRAAPAGLAQLHTAATKLAGELVLRLHRQLARRDLVPDEFGSGPPVDAEDPASVLAEWLRQLRLWTAYNPEEVFAIKAGALALTLLLVGIVAGVALFT
jgi:hypothetical protein